MDNQPTPPNPGNPEVGQTGVRPESLQAGTPEVVPSPEVAPAVGTSPTLVQAGAGASPKLTAADVAAAIAAVPGPVAPGVVVPTPTVAGDVDVIEPEWVAKAEEVVAQHQGDPYGEEEAVEDLQRDYLQKRYGYTVTEPDADRGKPKGT